MKATLDRDIIVHLTPHGATEIGNLPTGAGLERLRFDGKKVVDLASLSTIKAKLTEYYASKQNITERI